MFWLNKNNLNDMLLFYSVLDKYIAPFIVYINMTLVPIPYIPPTPPDMAFLYVLGMVIFLILMLSLLALLARDEIWEKQHSI